MSVHNQFPVLLSVEISETNDTFLIAVDVKDFGADSVKVTSWQDSLVVTMSTKSEPGQSYYLGELEPANYRRVIPLGFSVSEEDFYTTFSSGTLKIYLKKPSARQQALEDSSTSTPA